MNSDSTLVFIFLVFIGAAISVGFVIERETILGSYKTCRHYNQTIEFCIKELGWEGKQ